MVPSALNAMEKSCPDAAPALLKMASQGRSAACNMAARAAGVWPSCQEATASRRPMSGSVSPVTWLCAASAAAPALSRSEAAVLRCTRATDPATIAAASRTASPVIAPPASRMVRLCSRIAAPMSWSFGTPRIAAAIPATASSGSGMAGTHNGSFAKAPRRASGAASESSQLKSPALSSHSSVPLVSTIRMRSAGLCWRHQRIS